MKRLLLIFTFIILVLGSIGIVVYISNLPLASTNSSDLTQISVKLNTQTDSSVTNVICASDIKLCDNGGYVSRDSLSGCQFNCNNAVAPVNGVINCPQDVKQCEDGSFVIRNPNNNCEFKACN